MSQQQTEGKAVISNELIVLDSQLSTQSDVINLIARRALTSGYVSEEAELIVAVEKREAEIPTAIGYQIAMPHGKTAAVKHPFIAFLRTTEEFQWSEKDNEKVRLIFLIGVPVESEGKLHLKFISKLSKKLLDEEFREQLLTKNKQEEVLKLLSSINVD